MMYLYVISFKLFVHLVETKYVLLFIGQNDSDERAALLAIAKRRKGAPLYLEQNKDEEDAPDSYMNRVVGAADSYNLEVVKYLYNTLFLFSKLKTNV